MRNFKPYHDEDLYDCIDTYAYIRKFSGRMTPRREEIIQNYCKMYSWRERCHHDWDCCGCIYESDMSYTYQHNQVSILFVQHRNV